MNTPKQPPPKEVNPGCYGDEAVYMKTGDIVNIVVSISTTDLKRYLVTSASLPSESDFFYTSGIKISTETCRNQQHIECLTRSQFFRDSQTTLDKKEPHEHRYCQIKRKSLPIAKALLKGQRTSSRKATPLGDPRGVPKFTVNYFCVFAFIDSSKVGESIPAFVSLQLKFDRLTKSVLCGTRSLRTIRYRSFPVKNILGGSATVGNPSEGSQLARLDSKVGDPRKGFWLIIFSTRLQGRTTKWKATLISLTWIQFGNSMNLNWSTNLNHYATPQ